MDLSPWFFASQESAFSAGEGESTFRERSPSFRTEKSAIKEFLQRYYIGLRSSIRIHSNILMKFYSSRNAPSGEIQYLSEKIMGSLNTLLQMMCSHNHNSIYDHMFKLNKC